MVSYAAQPPNQGFGSVHEILEHMGEVHATGGSAEPSLWPTLAIHRAKDGWISFHRVEGTDFKGLFSVQAGDLENMFPQMRQYLLSDSFFSVNAYYRGAWWGSRFVDGLPDAHRCKASLRYLNCCFIDLDCYQTKLGAGTTIGELLEMQDRGDLPPASLFSRSGRGVWCFWLLRDPAAPDMPPHSFRPARLLWWRVQQELKARLAHLGAEANDAARVTRVDGSVNPKSGKRACYWPQFDQDGRPITYTLDELAQRLGVPAQPVPKSVAAAMASGSAATPRGTRAASSPRWQPKGTGKPHHRKGWAALQERRLRLFYLLWSKRVNFKEGCRHRAAMLCAHFLHRAGEPNDVICQEVFKLGNTCRPPLSGDEIRAAIKQGSNNRLKENGRRLWHRFKNTTIADWLKIDRRESRFLCAEETGGKGWPPEAKFRTSADPAPTAGERRERRRRAIQDCVVIFGGSVPSVRTIQEHLRTVVKLNASVGTIANDLKALALSLEAIGKNQVTSDGLFQ